MSTARPRRRARRDVGRRDRAAAHMVAFGRAGASPKHRWSTSPPGLGLVQGIVVDQHFEQRGRWGRLLAAVAQSPSLIGIGIDEDTAAVV